MMNVRIAKKIVGGRAEGRPMAVLNRAHRAWWGATRRWLGVTGRVPLSSAGLAVQGGYYFTLGDCYVYLLDITAGRWLLPIVKTDRQRQAVLEQIRRLGGPAPDGQCLVNGGDAFVASVERKFRNLPVVLAVNFTSAGDIISHQTVSWDSPSPSPANAKAEATLYRWRREAGFSYDVRGLPS